MKIELGSAAEGTANKLIEEDKAVRKGQKIVRIKRNEKVSIS
ncbi:hypothetical protein ACT7DB_01005 [Bacillus cereus]